MENNQSNHSVICLLADKVGELSLSSKKYDQIEIKDVNKVLTPDELNVFTSHLNDGAKLELNLEDNLIADNSAIVANLKLAGFLKVNVSEDKKKITCSKKTWGNKGKSKRGENAWKTIKMEENAKTDFIVEDELIDPFDSYQKFSKADDCITKPKPCKNCNCGRAEKENQEKQKQIDPNFKPECGKCYLGDAFRCSGCPYRGLPAFEPGQKIEFTNTTQTDVGALEEEKAVVNIKQGNKVKLDI